MRSEKVVGRLALISAVMVLLLCSSILLCRDRLKVYAADEITYHETEEEAAAELREAMKERRETVTIGLAGTTDEEGLKEIIGSVVEKAMAHTGEPDEGDYINFQYGSYKGYAKTTASGPEPVIEVTYTLTYYDNRDQEDQVEAEVERVLSGLGLSRMTDYEKVQAIYNYVCSNVSYEPEGGDIRRTAYGALIDGQAVCQGYSLALYRLLLAAGIDNRIIFGTGLQQDGTEGAHTWNIIELYGKYYYVDATWDDSTWSRDNFLKPAGSDFESGHKASDEYPENFFTEQYPLAVTGFPGDVQGAVMKPVWAAEVMEEAFHGAVRRLISKNAE